MGGMKWKWKGEGNVVTPACRQAGRGASGLGKPTPAKPQATGPHHAAGQLRSVVICACGVGRLFLQRLGFSHHRHEFRPAAVGVVAFGGLGDFGDRVRPCG